MEHVKLLLLQKSDHAVHTLLQHAFSLDSISWTSVPMGTSENAISQQNPALNCVLGCSLLWLGAPGPLGQRLVTGTIHGDFPVYQARC